MRIRTLELENFMPYRDPVQLDFTDLSLFAIIGETGSGKSSIVDAICYALYGRIPRIHTENGQRENIISRGAKQFHLVLTFDLGGTTYEIRRQGTAAREDIQIFRDGEQLRDLLKKKDADRYIEETLLHMSFDVFTRIIVLPQGQFDRFLKPDTPRARREILISLLDLGIYERIGKAANAHVLSLQGELAGLEHDLAGIDEASLSDEALAALETTVATTEQQTVLLQEQLKAHELAFAMTQQKVAKAQQLRALSDRLDSLDARRPEIETKRARLAVAQALTSFTASLADWNHLHDQRTTLEKEHGAALKNLEDAGRTLEAARAKREELETKATEAAFDRQLSAISDARNQLGELQSVAAQLEETQRQFSAIASKKQGFDRDLERLASSMETHVTEQKRLKDALADAQETVRQTEERFEQARTENAALVVQQSVKPGDVCPVCGQTVKTLTTHEEHRDFEQLKTARDTARHNNELVQKALNDREKQMEAVKARQAALQAQSAEAATEQHTLQERIGQLTAVLLQNPDVAAGGRDAPVAFLRKRMAFLHESETTIRTAQKTIATQVEDLRQHEEQAQQNVSQLQTRAATLEGQHNQALAQENALQGSLLTQARDHGFASIDAAAAAAVPPERIAAMNAELAAYDRDHATAQGQIELLRRELGDILPADADLEKARVLRDTTAHDLAQARERLTTAQQNRNELLARRSFLADRRTRKNGVTQQINLYQTVARDFGSKGMMNFVSSGILGQLLLTANDRLRILSKGRYELLLGEGDQMMVQDSFSASGPRDVTTLSGGETFLASLALALAVKDLLSSSVDLESFFIDEGFGTLDENSVQSVADVLESLRRDGSLIGIITHRADLVERFDTVLEVTSENGSAHIARREIA